MTQLSNFIPISRKLFKHGFWLEQRAYSRFEAWLDLLATARYDNTEARVLVNGKFISYQRGQVVASLRFLAERWGWNTSAVNRFLKLLQNEKMINRETAASTTSTIITICKYDTYNVNPDVTIAI